MSLPKFAKLMATNAADIFGLTQKGRIAPGKDADFVFIQPDSKYVLKMKTSNIATKLARMLAGRLAHAL